MRTSTDSTAKPDAVGTTLDVILAPLHEAWIEEARGFLDPAVDSSAPFWERWSVVRYLNDQFPVRFTLEGALIRGLRPSLDPHHMDALEAGADRLARLRLGLDRIGRRRGTAAEFAPMVEELLTALELWCVEIELATRHIERSELSAEGALALGRLEAFARPAS
jgi:hypothetical protein